MNQPNTPSQGGVNRRSFLQATSTVVGGAMLGALSIERSAFAAGNENELKLALVGCGGRGSGAAAQALATEGKVKLVAVADAFKDRLQGSLDNLLRQSKDRVDVPEDRQFVGFDGYKKAIELADVVILATPPGFRPIHFEEAVRQGKHVFMEKPVAVDAVGVRKVLAAAEEAKKKKLKVGVGLQRHHQLGYIATVKRLHDGQIGDILASHCYWNDGGVWVKPRQPGQTEMEYQMRNWYYFNWLSGDHINEQHIHNLDVINWVKNAYPVKAQGLGGRQVRTGKDYGEIYDHHAVEFEYADGSKMFSQCRHIRGCWNSVSEHVIGTKGKCNVGGHTITGDNPWRFRGDRPRDPYQQEHDDLFDAIRNDKEFNEAFNGAKSTLTAIMGRMATYSGQMIEWDKALNSEIDLMPTDFSWDAKPKVLPDENGFYPIAMPGTSVVV
ncbi:MAG: Gfo/Idh/MocA family oxidoreductase [Verrucomicrobiota bacterium]|nr:Gfo/Idh/MocA family oxidoreductase [Verrucomicrobiota bacterium]